MREIMFKGKRTDNGEWVEGGFFEEPYTDRTFIIRWNSMGIGFNEFIGVDEETVCQYTGLTDKSGKKIWENDIVCAMHIGMRAIGVMQYENGCLVLKGKEDRMYREWHKWDLKKLGNVFDNANIWAAMSRRPFIDWADIEI